jgi:eukaryotic-like serine/threonine-protein kinase
MTSSYGKYQVLEQVGEGGFGRVYRALDPLLKREVAIKTCTLRQTDVRARFVREAEIVASLKHPHIVTVYDFGVEDGEPYLVQEFLTGQDLQQVIESGTHVDLARKVRWLRQIGEGLRYAHAKGIIHRDIKPSNIRIQADGEVRIMDFGIAKLLEADQQLTQTGQSVGTTGYLAPEQLSGGDIDHRVDIFAFGVLSYQLIAGRRPFEGNSFTAVLYRILHEEPAPLRDIAPDCPPGLIAVIDRCLRKNRDERFASFAPVLEALDGVLRQLEGGAPADAAAVAAAMQQVDASPARRRTSPAVWGLGVATVAIALFGIINLATWTSGSPPTEDGDRIALDSTTTEPADSVLASDGRDSVPAVAATDAGTAGAAQAGGGAGTTTAGQRTDTGTDRAGERAGDAGRTTESPPVVPPAVLDMRRLVVFVTAEQPAIRNAAETELVNALTGAGYRIVDGSVVRATAGEPARGPNALASIARTHAAGWLLAVEVSASAAESVGGMYTGEATVSLRVYGAADGELAGAETVAVGSGGTPGRLGPTPDGATVEATRAAAYQAYRAARRILDSSGG